MAIEMPSSKSPCVYIGARHHALGVLARLLASVPCHEVSNGHTKALEFVTQAARQDYEHPKI